MHFVMSSECVHLRVTQIGGSTAVLETVVSCPREHVVVRSELSNILESLHRWRIQERPAEAWQSYRPVNNVVQLHLLGRSHNTGLWVDALSLLELDVTID